MYVCHPCCAALMNTTLDNLLGTHMTYRGPAENGVYKKESLAFIFSVVNRNGLNF